MDKVKDISNIEEHNNIENIRLIYPKETNVDKSKSSALYIQLDNNIVKDVQTYELLSKDEKENIELEKQIEETKKQIEEIKSQVSNSGENIEKLKKDRIAKNEKLTKKEDEQTDEFKVIEDLKAQVTKLEVKKTKIEEDITEIINKMWEEYELTPNNAGNYPMPENVQLTQRKVNNLRTDI